MGKLKSVEELFEGRHFDREVISLRVRWYLPIQAEPARPGGDDGRARPDDGRIRPLCAALGPPLVVNCNQSSFTRLLYCNWS
jgi:hypothetical protein